MDSNIAEGNWEQDMMEALWEIDMHKKMWSTYYPTKESVSKYYDYNPETGVLAIKEEWLPKYIILPQYFYLAKETIDLEGYKQIPDVADTIDGMGGLIKHIRSHKLIYILMEGKRPAHTVIDHIDRDRSNNIWTNLRLATRAQNRYNSKKPKNNTSGVKGLTYLEKSNRWKATVRKGGEIRTNTCSFEDKDILIQWLTDTRNELHKEFAAHS